VIGNKIWVKIGRNDSSDESSNSNDESSQIFSFLLDVRMRGAQSMMHSWHVHQSSTIQISNGCVHMYIYRMIVALLSLKSSIVF
jgi:hypothetical protein